MRDRLAAWFPSQSAVRNARWGRWLAIADDRRLWALRRGTVCGGAAIGALASVIPLPVQIPVAVLIALRLRLNIPAAIAGTLISNPLTLVPIWAAAWHAGAWITGAGEVPDWPSLGGIYVDPMMGLQSALDLLGLPILIGLPLVGIALAMTTYAFLSLAWRYSVASRQRARFSKRGVTNKTARFPPRWNS